MGKGGRQSKRIAEKKERAKVARRRARRRRRVVVWTSGIGLVALIGAALAISLGGSDEDLADGGCDGQGKATTEHPTYEQPPAMTIDTAKTYTATMETTCGTMKLRLFATEAPKTVNNFVFLARAGFYDGTIFHRVIPEFMIQGGDPQGTGRGGPGYEFGDENTGRQFDKPGLLAMANSGPGTNGSQFFITQVVINHLNAKGKCPGPQGCHSIFGELTEGTDVLERIIAVPKAAGDKPQTDVVITTVTIAES